MGHVIGGGWLNAKTKEKAMQEGFADAQEFAEYNVDREENPFGDYHGDFMFYNRKFDDADDAMDFFSNLGAYKDGVVMAKKAPKSSVTRYYKTQERIRKKKAELREKALEKFKVRTSATVGCKECKTRIATKLAIERNLVCPTCRNWMAPDYIKAKDAKLDEDLKRAEIRLKEETKEKGEYHYWAKYEVHC